MAYSLYWQYKTNFGYPTMATIQCGFRGPLTLVYLCRCLAASKNVSLNKILIWLKLWPIFPYTHLLWFFPFVTKDNDVILTNDNKSEKKTKSLWSGILCMYQNFNLLPVSVFRSSLVVSKKWHSLLWQKLIDELSISANSKQIGLEGWGWSKMKDSWPKNERH